MGPTGQDAEHYVREAERCSALGATAPNVTVARRWRALADQYIVLAEAVAARTRRAVHRRMAMQQAVQVPQDRRIPMPDLAIGGPPAATGAG